MWSFHTSGHPVIWKICSGLQHEEGLPLYLELLQKFCQKCLKFWISAVACCVHLSLALFVQIMVLCDLTLL